MSSELPQAVVSKCRCCSHMIRPFRCGFRRSPSFIGHTEAGASGRKQNEKNQGAVLVTSSFILHTRILMLYHYTEGNPSLDSIVLSTRALSGHALQCNANTEARRGVTSVPTQVTTWYARRVGPGDSRISEHLGCCSGHANSSHFVFRRMSTMAIEAALGATTRL